MGICCMTQETESGALYQPRETGMLLQCWWQYELIQPLWKTVWRCLKKLGIKAPCDPAIPLLGIYPEETKIEKDT